MPEPEKETSSTLPIPISIVICTHNRAGLFSRAVESALAQTLGRERFEILVIDSCSTDETAGLMREKFFGLPNLRYIQEARLGVSNARNTGWMKARGKYIAYLDDDATAEPEWVEQVLKIFETAETEPGAVGGKVILNWDVPPPPWLTPGNLHALGELDFSSKPILTSDCGALIGCNVCYPKEILRGVGGFDLSLGRYGTVLLSGEEIDMNTRIVGMGKLLYYDPAIVVHHHVYADRLCRWWHLKRAFWQGVSSAVSEIHQRKIGPRERVMRAIRQSRYLLMPPVRTLLIASDKKQKLYVWARNYLRRAGDIAASLGIHRYLLPRVDQSS